MLFDIDKYGIGVAIVFALAGLGLFLTAVKLMSSSMKTMSAGFTSHLLKKMQGNIWIGLLFGIAFTTMIQSSDGTVALAIGLIGAGLLTLKGAIPILLGANIGTATTALIVALGSAAGQAFIFIQYLPLMVFLGAALMLFVKADKKMNIAMLIFAVGAIFLGLKVLGTGMNAVTAQPWFGSFTKGVSFNPWVAMLANTGFTGVVQSSSATVTVVQHIYTFDGHGDSSMSIESAIAMVIGANIGTTFTALITSIGAPKDAKRIALVWLITNSIMALIIMPMINLYGDLMERMSPVNQTQIKDIRDLCDQYPDLTFTSGGYKDAYYTLDDGHGNMLGLLKENYNDYVDQLKAAETAQFFQLAWAHLMFNGFLVALFIWFVKPLVWFTHILIKEDKVHSKYEVHLPLTLIKENPDLALEAAQQSTNALGRMSEDYLTLCQSYIKTGDKKVMDEMDALKNLVERTRQAIYAYLIEIGSYDISKKNSNRQMSLVLVARSLEKIPLMASHMMKELADTSKRGALDISVQTAAELQTLYAVLLTMTTKAAKQLGRFSETRSAEIKDMNDYVDSVTQRYAKNFLARKEKRHQFDYINNLKEINRIAHHANRVNTYLSRKSLDGMEVKSLSSDLEKEILKGLV